jgi:release factor glutamine methyltransferase
MFSSNNKFLTNPQTIEDFLNFAGFQLKKFPNPQLEAEMLISFSLGKGRVWLKTHQDYILNAKEAVKSREIIERRKNNEPLAYIRRWKMWNNFKIEVSSDVLIPRDETEILANYIFNNSQKNKSGLIPSRTCISPDLFFSRDFEPKTILDIGTGSGCLAIFCAKKFPEAEITAIDICPKALNIAKKNARTHNVKINFIESDLLSCFQVPLEKGGFRGILKKYDIIIANLPYVPENTEITEDVKKEPHNAIFSGTDGLDLIRKLAEQLKSREILFHELWLEFWTAQETEIKNIFAEYNVEFLPDLSGDTYFARITPRN